MTSSHLLELGIQKRNKQIDTSWQELADTYSDGLFSTGESFRCWVKAQIRKTGYTNQASESKPTLEEAAGLPNYKESLEIHQNGTQSSNKLVRMSLEDSKDANALLKAHGYDPKAWELVSAKNNIWNSYSKVDKIMTLYASKITTKPRKDELTVEGIQEIFKAMSANYVSPTHVPSRYSVNGKMLEVNVTDLHLGKFCSTDANDVYDHHIAKERYFKIINDIVEKTKGYTFEKILFVFSHDFYHIDNPNGQTTAGTRQDVTMRWQELFKLGTEMLVEGIDLLSQFAPVHTCYVGANHDKMMSYFAIEYLSAWYRNNPNVTVDADPKIRKYIEFGKCLIGLTHGHAEGKRVKHVMPIEMPEAWGRTLYREIHRGHIHNERASVVEENGIIIRDLSSPSGTDNWHFENAYVGSIRKSENFIWDKENGLETTLYITF